MPNYLYGFIEEYVIVSGCKYDKLQGWHALMQTTAFSLLLLDNNQNIPQNIFYAQMLKFKKNVIVIQIWEIHLIHIDNVWLLNTFAFKSQYKTD